MSVIDNENLLFLGFKVCYTKGTKRAKQFGSIPYFLEWTHFDEPENGIKPSKIWEKEIQYTMDYSKYTMYVYIFRQGPSSYFAINDIEDKYCMKIDCLMDYGRYLKKYHNVDENVQERLMKRQKKTKA